MSMTQEKPTAEKPPVEKPPMRSSRWAWTALLASLVLYPLAIVVALGNQEDEWFPNLISTALALAPPVAGILLGVGSAKCGSRLGGLATALGGAWLALIVTFFVGANYLWSGESLVAPNVLAGVLAVIVGGAIEAHWYRRSKALRRSA